MNRCDREVLSLAGKARHRVMEAVIQELHRRFPDLPPKTPFIYWSEGNDAFKQAAGVRVDVTQILTWFHMFEPELQRAVIKLIGADHADLPAALSSARTWIKPSESVEPLIATAQAFRMAVDALPVGKDIRNRLMAHIDAHIAAIEALQ